MDRRNILTLSTISMLGLALLPGTAAAQQKSLEEQLVGTWTLVSADTVRPDGSKTPNFGSTPKGAAMHDASGRFTFMLMRSDLPKFAVNNRNQGTADENKAAVQGSIAFYGTYSVNEADKTVTYRVEGSSYPNINGTEQKRIIVSLTANELRYINPATTTGVRAEAVWKRASDAPSVFDYYR